MKRPWILWAVYAAVLVIAPMVWSSSLALTMLTQMGIAIIACLAYNVLLGQGGMLSFALAALRPELYSAAYPLGGTLPRPLWPLRGDAARKLPIVIALHGEDDPRVPIGPARLGVQALRDAGYHAELRGFAGVGHGVSPLMRRELWALLGS